MLGTTLFHLVSFKMGMRDPKCEYKLITKNNGISSIKHEIQMIIIHYIFRFKYSNNFSIVIIAQFLHAHLPSIEIKPLTESFRGCQTHFLNRKEVDKLG